MDTRFKPVVSSAGFDVLTSVNTLEGHASAAAIADSILKSARAVRADLLVAASHGGCAMRSCREHWIL
jgi:hypothetical protein